MLQDSRDWVVNNDELLTRLMKCCEGVDSRGKNIFFPDIDKSFSLIKHLMNIDELFDKLAPSCEWTPAPEDPQNFSFQFSPWENVEHREESSVVIQT